MIQKPSYSTSKRGIWISGALAWAMIVLIIAAAIAGSRNAVDLAPLVIPSMVALIVAMLGVHRGFGSLDMRTISKTTEGMQ